MILSNVKNISIEGRNITQIHINGNKVWEVPVVNHTVTYNLSSCMVAGTVVSSVTHEDSFSCTLRHEERVEYYGSIRVTMGGIDITDSVCTFSNSTYAKWSINIPSVTGDITITCSWFSNIEYSSVVGKAVAGLAIVS